MQLDDRLIALLDQRSGSAGVSRSAIIRAAIEAYLADDADAAIDAEIVAGYAQNPADEPDPRAMALAVASIEDEPW